MLITLTGATGFLGQQLTEALRAEGHGLRFLSRKPGGAQGVYEWNPLAEPPPAESLDGAGAVIHLAGEPVAQRWTTAARERIRGSRTVGTRNLVEALSRMKTKPEVLVSASATGFYGSRGDEILTEASPAGTGFLAEVCQEWEEAVEGASKLGIRVVRLRLGVVLGREGGALAKMLPAFRAGLGGPLAGGKQWMSWIHVEDAVRLMAWSVAQGSVRGAVNAVSPNPAQNKNFTRALGGVLRRPAVFPVPRLALQLLYGEMSEVLTGSQRVEPRAALAEGFGFQHEDVVESLRSLLY
jgi:uncharacterized protein (TIGR01777 family)